jgi:PAS domain S-box-containing protein
MLEKVSEKKRLEREAKANMLFLEAYQEALDQSTMVIKIDAEDTITYANDAIVTTSGYTRNALIGERHTLLHHPDVPDAQMDQIRTVTLEQKQTWKGLLRCRHRFGQSCYADAVVVPIVDIEGRILERVALFNDVTHILHPVSQLKDAIRNAQEPIVVYMRLNNFEMLEEFYGAEVIEEIQDTALSLLDARFSREFDYDKMYRLDGGDFAFVLERFRYLQDERDFVRKLKQCQESIHQERIDLYRSESDMSIMMSVAYRHDHVLESAKLGIRKLIKTKRRFIVSNNLANFERIRARKNIQTASIIKDALEHSRVVAYFQPIIDNRTESIAKYETLVRLIDKAGNILTPFHFLEAAKKSDLYPHITLKMLEYAFSFLKVNAYDITINLSILDIEQTPTRKAIFALMEEHKQNA